MKFAYTDLIKARDYTGKQAIRYVQVKRDGLRLAVIKRGTDDVTAITREGKTDLWPKLREVARLAKQVAKIPANSVADCELHIPGTQATDIKTRVNEASDELQISPFAVPFCDGNDWRMNELQAVMNVVERWGMDPCPLIQDSEITMPISSKFKRELLELARAEKFEGFVLKAGHYHGWYKLKPVRTVDCVVTGVSVSDSDSFYGGLKAIQVSLDGVEVASVGSGFDSEYRMLVDMNSLIGRVAEISYDSLAGKGKLKFPRFVRWRSDKTPAECTMDQLDVHG